MESEESNEEYAETEQELENIHEDIKEINEKKEENYMKYLIGIAVIIGVGWYFISEPFSTKVDRAIDENSNWNPTTILEDPDAYIYGALQHLDNLEKNLKEEKFRVNTRLNQMTREQETGKRILSNLNDDIKRWKSDYKILDGRIEGVTQTKGYDKATLRDLIIFVNTICRFNNGIDVKKLKNAIQSTTFEKLQNLENIGKFSENVYSTKDKKKIKFFFLGPKNNWKDKLNKDLIKRMNTYYKEDLERFGYEI